MAGVVQVVVQIPVLRRLGFRFDYRWGPTRQAVAQIATAMAPMVLGLAVTQINTLLDSLIAWGMAPAGEGPEQIVWLGGRIRYPLEQGAAAALFFGERLYQFPVGVLGIAVAASIFPLLSRHAARGDRAALGADLTLGLQLVLFLAVPAGVGLWMLAEPLARLLFEHGHFTPEDTARTARTISCYALGVWAFCALPVIVRGYYALGNYLTTAKVAVGVVAANFTLNLLLIWTPLREAGLALATSLSAAFHVVVLLLIFSGRQSRMHWSMLGFTAARSLAATLGMALAGFAVLATLGEGDELTPRLLRVVLPLGVSVGVYGGLYVLLGGREPAILLGSAAAEKRNGGAVADKWNNGA